jgi:hypothetical protein
VFELSPLPATSQNLIYRTLLTYLTARTGEFPRGLIDDADLDALKSFVIQHPDLSERCGVTKHEMDVLLKAVEGVQGG